MTSFFETLKAWWDAAWAWSFSVRDWLLSAIVSAFDAGKNFLSDWMYYGLDWATTRSIMLANGIDIQIPTLHDVISMLPAQAQLVLARVDFFVCVNIIAAAILTRGGLRARRVFWWLTRS